MAKKDPTKDIDDLERRIQSQLRTFKESVTRESVDESKKEVQDQLGVFNTNVQSRLGALTGLWGTQLKALRDEAASGAVWDDNTIANKLGTLKANLWGPDIASAIAKIEHSISGGDLAQSVQTAVYNKIASEKDKLWGADIDQKIQQYKKTVDSAIDILNSRVQNNESNITQAQESTKRNTADLNARFETWTRTHTDNLSLLEKKFNNLDKESVIRTLQDEIATLKKAQDESMQGIQRKETAVVDEGVIRKMQDEINAIAKKVEGQSKVRMEGVEKEPTVSQQAFETSRKQIEDKIKQISDIQAAYKIAQDAQQQTSTSLLQQTSTITNTTNAIITSIREGLEEARRERAEYNKKFDTFALKSDYTKHAGEELQAREEAIQNLQRQLDGYKEANRKWTESNLAQHTGEQQTAWKKFQTKYGESGEKLDARLAAVEMVSGEYQQRLAMFAQKDKLEKSLDEIDANFRKAEGHITANKQNIESLALGFQERVTTIAESVRQNSSDIENIKAQMKGSTLYKDTAAWRGKKNPRISPQKEQQPSGTAASPTPKPASKQQKTEEKTPPKQNFYSSAAPKDLSRVAKSQLFDIILAATAPRPCVTSLSCQPCQVHRWRMIHGRLVPTT